MADIQAVVPTLAQQTIQRVAAGLESGEAAGLSEIVELIQQLSNNALETSVQDLADLIGKDVVVTAKVITAANTIGYNPTGVEVTTITQAIHVIGFNKIRQLAVSLLLVENAERTLNPTEKREIAALALCSGLMAETVMAKHGSLSPEHAFICASLRNYGRLLMTTFMIDEYRRARIMATEGLGEDVAFERVFGLTPLELGYHLLASAHLPPPILKSLRSLPPDAIKLATSNPDLQLLTLADMSVKVCELALRPDIGPDEFEQRAGALASRSGRVFGLDKEGVFGVLREAGTHLSNFANTFGLNGISSSLGARIHARVTREEIPEAPLPVVPMVGGSPVVPAASAPLPSAPSVPPAAAAGGGAAPHPVAPKGSTPPGAPKPRESLASRVPLSPETPAPVAPIPLPDLRPAAEKVDEKPTAPLTAEASFQNAFDTGIEQVAGLLNEEPIDLRRVFIVTLHAALRGFGAAEAIVFVRDHAKGPYSAMCGKGSVFDGIRGQGVFRETDRNVFGLCLQRMEDVLIYDAADEKIAPHLPPWVRTPKLASFVLLPIIENRRPFAVLLAGWPEKKTVGFSVAQIRQVRSMLKLVGTARKLAE